MITSSGPKCDICEIRLRGDCWRDVRKELPVTPFLAYWTDGRITILEDGDSVAYAIAGDPEKRVIGWKPLREVFSMNFNENE